MDILEKITSSIFSPRTKSLTVRIVGTNYIDAETNYIARAASGAVTPGGTTVEERKLSDGSIRAVPVKPYTAVGCCDLWSRIGMKRSGRSGQRARRIEANHNTF